MQYTPRMETPEKTPIAPTEATEQAALWDALVASFVERYFEAHPTFGAGAGRHELDGRLPDWSLEAFDREVAQLQLARQQALGFDPALLDETRRFERELLVAVTESDLFWLEEASRTARTPSTTPRRWTPTSTSPATTLPWSSGCGPTSATRWRCRGRRRRCGPTCALPLPRTFAELGEKSFGGLAGYYETDVPAVFAAVDDAGLQRQMREANARRGEGHARARRLVPRSDSARRRARWRVPSRRQALCPHAGGYRARGRPPRRVGGGGPAGADAQPHRSAGPPARPSIPASRSPSAWRG